MGWRRHAGCNNNGESEKNERIDVLARPTTWIPIELLSQILTGLVWWWSRVLQFNVYIVARRIDRESTSNLGNNQW